MKRKIFFGGVGGIFLAIVGLMFYVMTQMEIEHLILCSTNEGGTRIPSSLCYNYMLNYRINEQDVKALSEGAGLDYILHAKPPKRYEIAEAFIARGLDVNGVSHYSGMTPLQATAQGGEVKNVKFLLKQGADLRLTGNKGMTALALARKMHVADSKLRDRAEIIQILSDAENEN